jgi:TPR repeat protein
MRTVAGATDSGAMKRRIFLFLAIAVTIVLGVIPLSDYRFWVFNDASLALKTGEYGQAMRLLRPWAAMGDSKAQYILGELYAFGWGVMKDDETAVYWYRRAGLIGPVDPSDSSVTDSAAPAMYYVGKRYIEGTGVSRDKAEARKWFERSAKGGFVQANEELKRLQ